MDEEAKYKMENKFSYFRELSKEELLKLKQELEEDLDFLEESYKTAKSDQQSDIWTDIKYDKEQLSYIKQIESEGISSKQRR